MKFDNLGYGEICTLPPKCSIVGKTVGLHVNTCVYLYSCTGMWNFFGNQTASTGNQTVSTDNHNNGMQEFMSKVSVSEHPLDIFHLGLCSFDATMSITNWTNDNWQSHTFLFKIHVPVCNCSAPAYVYAPIQQLLQIFFPKDERLGLDIVFGSRLNLRIWLV